MHLSVHFLTLCFRSSVPTLAKGSKLSMLTKNQRFWRKLALGFASIFVCVGCSRVVLVTEASPIRIGPKCETQIYTLINGEWKLGDNRVTIPEGWYAVPPSYVDSEK